MAKKDTEKKGRDRIAFILYALYAFFLVMGVVFIVRIIQIQNFWEPDKETENEKVMLPDAGGPDPGLPSGLRAGDAGVGVSP
jgi:hypothetical protein